MNATLIIGALVGVGVGMFLFSLTVPENNEMQRLNRMYSTKGSYTEFGNRKGIMMVSGGTVPAQMMRNNFGTTVSLTGTAVESSVTNEKQFLSEMLIQNENAIRLAHRVLSLKDISEKITTLAENVIKDRSEGVSVLKGLLSPKTETENTKSKTR